MIGGHIGNHHFDTAAARPVKKEVPPVTGFDVLDINTLRQALKCASVSKAEKTGWIQSLNGASREDKRKAYARLKANMSAECADWFTRGVPCSNHRQKGLVPG
ncbi:MAG: hypothetical protein M3O22_05765 [Pseudomonadota bacterium]|nr:hypothetical protein [Pseudomonadota bacterium]